MRSILFLFTLLILHAGTSTALDLDSLLVNSIGGPEAVETLRNVRTAYARGTIDYGGQPGTFETFFVAPDRYRTNIKVNQVNWARAYDGTTAWRIDLNGNISILEGRERRDVMSEVYFESYSWLFPDRCPGHVEYHGEKRVRHKTYYLVAFYPFDQDSTKRYYDKIEGLNRISYSYSDNNKVVSENSDFRKISGVMVPFKSIATSDAMPIKFEVTLDTIIFNGPIDTTMFLYPDAKKTDYRFPETADSVGVMFDYYSGHIYIPATVNGKKEAWFILDSGASGSVLDDDLADDLDLPSVGTIPTRGIGGFDEANLVRVDSFSIGSLLLQNQVCGDFDMSGVASEAPSGDTFGGVLGFDFISRFPLLVDYRDSMITVYNPDQFTPPDGGMEVPFEFESNVPRIKAELNGIPGDFIVDLGNASGLIIHSEFAKEHDLLSKLEDVRKSAVWIGGVGGNVRSTTALARDFTFGDIRIDTLRVILPESSTGLTGSSELAGNIGNLVLQRYRVLFDYEHKRLIFYPQES